MVSLSTRLWTYSDESYESKTSSFTSSLIPLLASMEEENEKSFVMNGGEAQPLLDKKETSHRYTPRQKKLFVLFTLINVTSAMCYSIQAPFYPKEATEKGVSSSVYGFVFGVFELTDFLACPIYGKYIRQIGPKFMLNAGNFVMASCCILFGFLDRIESRDMFIAFSFIVRIVEALGQAGFITASYAILAQEFPEDIARAFSILETLFSVGVIIGPTFGGFLYEIGGFQLPFFVTGGILLAMSLIATLFLPKTENSTSRPVSLWKLLRIPRVSISYFAVVAVAFSIGFNFALLQPQLEQFALTPIIVGVVFAIVGISYALTAIIWGYLADKHVNPMILCGSGGIFISVAFLFMGPFPVINVQPMLSLIIVALVLQGIGAGGEYIAAFIDTAREARKHGFPDTIETYGLISGLWASGLALGSFCGPSLSGVLNDAIGFRNTTVVVFGQHVLVAILAFSAYFYEKSQKKNNPQNDEISDTQLESSQLLSH